MGTLLRTALKPLDAPTNHLSRRSDEKSINAAMGGRPNVQNGPVIRNRGPPGSFVLDGMPN
ncbi:MAG: hypothetical protein ACK4WC_06750 [Rubrimonas sp.]